MLDLKRIRSETARVREAIEYKKSPADLDRLLALDEQRRDLLGKTETLKHQRNEASEEIGRKKKRGEGAADAIQAMKRVGDEIKALDAQVAAVEGELDQILLWIPNMPHASVPRARTRRKPGGGDGRGAADVRLRSQAALGARDESLGLLDFERAAKIAGAGFLLFTGRGARLERALINFMLDLHTTKHGYTEVSPPHVVRRAALFGTGQLPKLEGDMYRIGEDDLFLNPDRRGAGHEHLPRRDPRAGVAAASRSPRYCASYRREAGAAGRDTRGMIRVHQFDKVELVKIVRARDELRRAREARARRRPTSSRRSSCRTACCCSAAAT